jgi:hypothetical protein
MLGALLRGSGDSSWAALLFFGFMGVVAALVALFASTANREDEIMFLEFLIEAFDASVVGRSS